MGDASLREWLQPACELAGTRLEEVPDYGARELFDGDLDLRVYSKVG